LAIVITTSLPLSTAGNEKINMSDGLYMYDSWIEHLLKGGISVRFEKCFVVKNNIIYSFQDAMKKIGVSKLNKLFADSKKYKILFGGENIGEIYNVKKNIKEGPAYGSGAFGHGSAVKCLAVPEKYKEVKKKVYTTIPQEEVDKIAKLAKEKLLPLLISRKGFAKYKITEMELYKDSLLHLDKISYRNDELYIGRYQYAFKTAKNAYWFDIIFSARKDSFHIVTTDYEEGDLVAGYMTIYGMLDVDGCGEDELIIEKEAPREGETTIWLEIHKQKPDGNWTRITVSKTRRIL
jgi:hypothetical protein